MIIKLWNNTVTRLALIFAVIVILVALIFLWIYYSPMGKVSYSDAATAILVATSTEPVIPPIPAHILTPDSVRAVYMSSWAAGNDKFRKHLFDLIDTTEINAVVIDVKDYSGKISFPVDDPELQKVGAAEKRIPDIKEFLQSLHAKNIYVIGRVSTFQDSFLVKGHPEWAVKTKEGAVWQDYKGVKWLDAGAKPVWDYIATVGREAYSQGFDELNFDYIRFPSDGNMKDIAYSWSEGKSREETMKSFFEYIHGQFASTSIPTSADMFGLVTSSRDDLGIGQVLEDGLANFDYVSPMVYPSHFGAGYNGYPKPATEPYGVIHRSMSSAVERAVAATSSPSKLRPWLQAFDLGAIYTPAMVRTQIQATYDVGLNSWMLWDAGSIYDKRDLLAKGEDPFASTTAKLPLNAAAASALSTSTSIVQ